MAAGGRAGLCPPGGLEQLELGRLRDPLSGGSSCSPSPPLSSCSRQAWSRDNPGFEPEEEEAARAAAAAAAGPVLQMDVEWGRGRAGSPSSGGRSGSSESGRRQRRRRGGEEEEEEERDDGGERPYPGGGGEGDARAPHFPHAERVEGAGPPPHRVAWAKGLARRLRGE
ncbi:polycystin-2-like [Eublepharis macularius]|uniref:Polycystin-2-like n=1 Tax=Eublepharis macularius TaxID=481883 RepID=A0AA97JY28_EUBMA|nr:polycystin-2-like [Eublepharis macularius]